MTDGGYTFHGGTLRIGNADYNIESFQITGSDIVSTPIVVNSSPRFTSESGERHWQERLHTPLQHPWTRAINNQMTPEQNQELMEVQERMTRRLEMPPEPRYRLMTTEEMNRISQESARRQNERIEESVFSDAGETQFRVSNSWGPSLPNHWHITPNSRRAISERLVIENDLQAPATIYRHELGLLSRKINWFMSEVVEVLRPSREERARKGRFDDLCASLGLFGSGRTNEGLSEIIEAFIEYGEDLHEFEEIATRLLAAAKTKETKTVDRAMRIE